MEQETIRIMTSVTYARGKDGYLTGEIVRAEYADLPVDVVARPFIRMYEAYMRAQGKDPYAAAPYPEELEE